ELIGKRIALRLVPIRWPRDLGLFKERNSLARLKETVLAQREWLPILEVDDQQFFKYSFSDSGAVHDATAGGWAKEMDGDGQTVGGQIGDILVGHQGAEPKATMPAEVTALWIDYEIRVPGERTRTIRRE